MVRPQIIKVRWRAEVLDYVSFPSRSPQFLAFEGRIAAAEIAQDFETSYGNADLVCFFEENNGLGGVKV